jgi:hypothetical protein
VTMLPRTLLHVVELMGDYVRTFLENRAESRFLASKL